MPRPLPYHLPLIPAGHRLQALGALVLVHTLVGIPLALFWRRSRNLWPAVAAHALLDAVRNALLGG